MNEQVRVLIFNTEGAWVAQCLEHDVSVQAESIDVLQRRFEDAMCCESEHFDTIGAAPKHFFDQWDAARALSGAPENTEMRLAA
jgi:hypothetical protein